MYEIKIEPFGSINQIKLINTKTGESVGILADYGATLNSLSLSKKSRLYDLIDGSPDYQHLMGDGTSTFKGMILFPFPNRVKGGLYTYEGRMYQFDVNEGPPRNHALHGLVLKSKFEVKRKDANTGKAEVEIIYEEKGNHPAYPYKATLSVIYTLSKEGLTIQSTVVNTDSKTFPVGLGWHPYFKTGSKVDTLEFHLPKHKDIPTDNMIPTGKIMDGFAFVSPEAIESVSLDNGYQLSGNEEISTTKIHDPSKEITVEIWQKRGTKSFDYLQVYIPTHRDTIAVEPQTCAVDAFNNKMGLVELKPGEKLITEWGVSLS